MTVGAPFIACSTSTTAGSGSNSTTMASAASRATYRSRAKTTANRSPTKTTGAPATPRARGGERIELDDDGVRGVARDVSIARNDHGNRLADETDGVDGHRAMLGRGKR